MAQQTYNQGYANSVVQSHLSRKAYDTCGYFIDQLKPNYHILDAGCGPGSVTASLAEFVPQGRVVGIDISGDVIKKAQSQENLPARCSFEVGDITKSLSFDDNTFDVVYTSQTLCHIPDALVAMRELRRVCKPGGFLACREGDSTAAMLYPLHEGLLKWQNVLVETMKKTGCHPKAARLLVSWASTVGFTLSKTHYSVGSLTYALDQVEFWGKTMAARAMEDQVWRQKAMACGCAQPDDFELMRDAWLQFTHDKTAVFSMPCGQLVCYK